MRRNRVAFFIFICALFLPLSSATASGLIHTSGPYFKDTQGRTVLLRGVNVSDTAKAPPFNPIDDLSDLQQIHDLGFNTIRLLFIWEAFEPERGVYDYSYLDRMGQVIRAAALHGIYVFVDFHMDAFSRFTVGGCGDGAPKWAIAAGHAPEQPKDGPHCPLTTWAANVFLQYLQPHSGFRESEDEFYSDVNGVRTHYLAAWAEMAHYFKNFPNVLGYDLLNEPWGEDKTQILPLYEDAARVVRAEDPEAILFIEPSLLETAGWVHGSIKPSFDNFAFSPHVYDAVALAFGIWTGWVALDHTFEDDVEKAIAWNVPIFIGEFGVAGKGVNLNALLLHYYRLFEEHFVSSAQWNYSSGWTEEKKDGWNMEDMSIVAEGKKARDNVVLRPYPTAIAGIPISTKSDDSYVELRWQNDPALGTTDFFFPPAKYPDLSRVVWVAAGAKVDCRIHQRESMLSCSSSAKGPLEIVISERPSPPLSKGATQL